MPSTYIESIIRTVYDFLRLYVRTYTYNREKERRRGREREKGMSENKIKDHKNTIEGK